MPRSPKDYLDEANSPATPASRLRELATKEWPFVREAVANHPQTPPDLLTQLLPTGYDPADEPLAIALAKRVDTSPEVLTQLARRVHRVVDTSCRNIGFELGKALACNPSTPLSTLRDLLDPGRATPHFHKRIATHTRRTDVLTLLAADISDAVRKSALHSLKKLLDATQTKC